MSCEHNDYDDYFQICNDCGKRFDEVTRCEYNDYGICAHCGYAPYADYPHSMVRDKTCDEA